MHLWGLPGHTTNVDAFRLNYLMSHCKSVSVLLSYCKVAGFPNCFLWYQGRLSHLQWELWWKEAAQHSSEGAAETWTYWFGSQKLELMNAGNNRRNWVLRSTSSSFSRRVCQTRLLGGGIWTFLHSSAGSWLWHTWSRNKVERWDMFSGKTCRQTRSLCYVSVLPMVTLWHGGLLCLTKAGVLCREFVSWLQAQGWFGLDKSVPKLNALPGRGRDAGMKRDAMPLVVVFLQKLSDVNIAFSA